MIVSTAVPTLPVVEASLADARSVATIAEDVGKRRPYDEAGVRGFRPPPAGDAFSRCCCVRRAERRIGIVERFLRGVLLVDLSDDIDRSSLVCHRSLTHRPFRAVRFSCCIQEPGITAQLDG